MINYFIYFIRWVNENKKIIFYNHNLLLNLKYNRYSRYIGSV